MKITIEDTNEVITFEKEIVTAEELVRLFYYIMISTGYSPINVSEWMVEIGEQEREALK